MKKKFILMSLFLFSRSLSCMQQRAPNDQSVIYFDGESDQKTVNADELVNLSASEVDLESGLQFQNFYNEKEKKIKGLLLYMALHTGIKRTNNRENHNDVMANYVCTIASNLEKLSEHIAQDAKDAKELADKNLKLFNKKINHDFLGILITGGIAIASLVLTLKHPM